MVDTGYTTPVGKVVVRGNPPIKIPKNVGVATNMYPGRLVVRENTDHDVKVADGILPPVGLLEWENSPVNTRPADIDSIYTVDTEAMVVKGGGYAARGKLASGFVAVMGDKLFSWSNGRVVPGKYLNGIPAIKIPFSKNTAEKDTGIDLVAKMKVALAEIEVVTAVAGSTIDVGPLSSETGGDADGFLDGASCASAGRVELIQFDASAANITVGALLEEDEIVGDVASGSAAILKRAGYEVAEAVSVAYTTSNHDIAGYIYLAIDSPGVVEVGRAGASVDASAADKDIIIEAVI